MQRVADHADSTVVHLRQSVLVHPVTAVDLELLVHAEAEPGLEQADAVGTHNDCDNGVGILRDRGDGRAVILGADWVPDDLRHLATELLVSLHDAKRYFVTPGIVLADECDIARAEFFEEIVAEGMAYLAGGYRSANHCWRPIPFRHVVGAGSIHHQRNAGLLAHLRHGRAFVSTKRSDHDLHLLLVYEATRLGNGLVRIASCISDHVFNFASACRVVDLLPEQFEAVDHVGTWC